MTKWYQTQAKSDVKCVDKMATNGDQICHEKHRQIDKFLSVKFKFIYIYIYIYWVSAKVRAEFVSKSHTVIRQTKIFIQSMIYSPSFSIIFSQRSGSIRMPRS